MKSGRSRRETVELFILLQIEVKRVFSEYIFEAKNEILYYLANMFILRGFKI